MLFFCEAPDAAAPPSGGGGAALDPNVVRVTATSHGGRRIVSLDGDAACDVYDRRCDAMAPPPPVGGGGGGDEGEVDRSAEQATRTTLNPLARSVVDGGGVTRYFPLHPQYVDAAPREIGLFAATHDDEVLTVLNGTRRGLVEAAGVATARTRANLRDPKTGAPIEVAGALAIYCAGAAAEVARGSRGSAALDDVGRAIRAALGSGDNAAGAADAKTAAAAETATAAQPQSTPMLGGFTFGEQGPLLSDQENCQANLMFNLLVFGAKGGGRGVSPRKRRFNEGRANAGSSEQREPARV